MGERSTGKKANFIAATEKINEFGRTPFLQAVFEGKDIAILEDLLKKGCNLHAKDYLDRDGALAFASLNGHLNIVKFLHTVKGLSVNERNKHGFTPLHWSAMHGRESVTSYLLSNGADMEVENRCGRTPLLVAIVNDEEVTANLLINQGCNFQAKDEDGDSALALASQKGNLSLVRKLYSLGLNVNGSGLYNFTPLHWAAQSNFVDVVNYLLLNGADPKIRNTTGQTAFETAFLSQQNEVVEFFLRNGYNDAEDVRVLQSLQGLFSEIPVHRPPHSRPTGGEVFLSTTEEGIYERALKSGTVVVERLRLMFVGQDGSGKTSLIRSLLGKPFDEDVPSTDGVAIEVAVTDAEKWKDSASAAFLEKSIKCGFYSVKRSEETEKSSLAALLEKSQQSALFSKPDASRSKTRTQETTPLNDPEFTAWLKFSQHHMAQLNTYIRRASEVETQSLHIVHLWDLGGQETYLSTHCSLLPCSAVTNSLTAFVLVVNLALPLEDLAKSAFRSTGGSLTDHTKDLGWIETNGDFMRLWLSNFATAYSDPLASESVQPHLGDTEQVANPPVFIAGTHFDLPETKRTLAKQSQIATTIVEDRHYEDHIVRPADHEGEHQSDHFFLIDNTQSSSCPGVKELKRRIDQMTESFYSKKKPQPFRWLLLEFLIAGLRRRDPIVKAKLLTDLAIQLCGIPDKAEVSLALDQLESLGIVFRFCSVPVLKEEVFIDPVWVVKKLAIFVTAEKPPPRLMSAWRRTQKTGKMGRNLIKARLADAEVPEGKHGVVLELLHHLNVTTPVPFSHGLAKFDTEDLFIPCLLTKKFAESVPFLWQEIDVSDPFPPPLVLIPRNVDAVPEALFFRLATRFLRKYESPPDGLTRHRYFFTTPFFDFELLYNLRGKQVILSVGGNVGDLRGSQWVAEVKDLKLFFEAQMREVRFPGMGEFDYELKVYLKGGLESKALLAKGSLFKLRENEAGLHWLTNDGGKRPSQKWSQKALIWTGLLTEGSATDSRILSSVEDEALIRSVAEIGNDKWDEIGIYLGFQTGDLAQIKQDVSSNLFRTVKIIEDWCKRQTNPTVGELWKACKRAGISQAAVMRAYKERSC